MPYGAPMAPSPWSFHLTVGEIAIVAAVAANATWYTKSAFGLHFNPPASGFALTFEGSAASAPRPNRRRPPAVRR